MREMSLPLHSTETEAQRGCAAGGHAPAFPTQGTPLKYDTSTSSTGSKKHDVRSIIGSPGRTFPAVHPLDVMADTRALERACYEESLKSRSGADRKSVV